MLRLLKAQLLYGHTTHLLDKVWLQGLLSMLRLLSVAVPRVEHPGGLRKTQVGDQANGCKLRT